MTDPIRVCLVDDQTLVRQGIRSLLELSPSISVVARLRKPESAVMAASKPGSSRSGTKSRPACRVRKRE